MAVRGRTARGRELAVSIRPPTSTTIVSRTSPPPPAALRRAGTPVARRVAAEDESQEHASLAVGTRVKHRKFGPGTIADLSGTGREAKVKVDFDDESIGRKTLVVAQANLEPS